MGRLILLHPNIIIHCSEAIHKPVRGAFSYISFSNNSCNFFECMCRRGLSKHYKGKSQSFTSLAEVESLQDLAKPENPYNKRLKSAKSLPFNTNYLKLISKTSAGTYVVSERQPAVTQPRRTSSTSDFAKHQTPLFA